MSSPPFKNAAFRKKFYDAISRSPNQPSNFSTPPSLVASGSTFPAEAMGDHTGPALNPTRQSGSSLDYTPLLSKVPDAPTSAHTDQQHSADATKDLPITGQEPQPAINDAWFNAAKEKLESFHQTLEPVPVPGLKGATVAVLKIVEHFEVHCYSDI